MVAQRFVSDGACYYIPTCENLLGALWCWQFLLTCFLFYMRACVCLHACICMCVPPAAEEAQKQTPFLKPVSGFESNQNIPTQTDRVFSFVCLLCVCVYTYMRTQSSLWENEHMTVQTKHNASKHFQQRMSWLPQR